MFLEASFIIPKGGKNPNVHQLIDKCGMALQQNTIWPIKRNRVLAPATIWMSLVNTILCEGSQSQKTTD